MVKTLLKIAYVLLFALIIPLSIAIPPIATEFYGTATIYDFSSTPVSAGSVVEALVGGNSCGRFTMTSQGFYGLLSCVGNESAYTNLSVGYPGANVDFTINGVNAWVIGDTTWEEAAYRYVNLIPEPICGDGICNLNEDCRNCETDCGQCQVPIPGGDDDDDDDGDGGGGGGGGGVGGDIIGDVIGSIPTTIVGEACKEQWVCSEWPECPPWGIRTRNCTDLANCGTDAKKPPEEEQCIYYGDCFDSILTGAETDVDCGGWECERCDLGKRCKVNSDCKSDFCHPEELICKLPTCFDGYRNGDEEGVDCGGPCSPCPRESIPLLEQPGVIFVGCGSFPWFIILAVAILALIVNVYGRFYISRIKASKEYKKDRVQGLKRIMAVYRELNLFSIASILIATVVSLYMYYFCKIVVWVLVSTVLLSPFVIYFIARHFEYIETRAKRRKELMIENHEQSIKNLLGIVNREMLNMEGNIAKKIYERIALISPTSEEYKAYPLLKSFLDMLGEVMTPEIPESQRIKREEAMLGPVEALSKNVEFDALAKKSVDLASIRYDLETLAKSIKDKHGLYKEIEEDEKKLKEVRDDKDKEPDKKDDADAAPGDNADKPKS